MGKIGKIALKKCAFLNKYLCGGGLKLVSLFTVKDFKSGLGFGVKVRAFHINFFVLASYKHSVNV